VQVTPSRIRVASPLVRWSPERRRLTSWTVIAFFALLSLFLGSCPDGAMAGPASTAGSGDWFYQCPIVRAFVPTE
jgi:hypothetical protein